MRALLLLHGFKRNGEDDFKETLDFFNNLNFNKIYNEEWFENYNKKTLTIKHFKKKVTEISNKINNDKVDELKIVCYSSGVLLAPLIKKKINTINVNIISIAPPIKILFAKWIPAGINSLKNKKKLKKKIGKERYKRLKEISEKNKIREKHPLKIILFINKLRLKYRKRVINETNIKFLISPIDEFLKSSSITKILEKRNHNITLKEFSHEKILKNEKEIAIKWLKKHI